jgi:glycosyltransferase involved in cell wall biosynthesis
MGTPHLDLEAKFLAMPLISVLIDTYNHERFIEKAINSVLEQDFPVADREIIVVDDGSTDGTPQIVKRFEPNLRYIRKENGGQASAFNIGIPECRGQIIAFLDGDDYWLPRKLSRVADVLAKNPAVGFVGHAINEHLPDGQERISALANDEKFRIQSLDSARLFRLRKSFLGTSRMTIRAEIARSILPVPEALMFEADEYLFTLAAAMSEVVILQEALTYYVIHGSNLYVSAGSGKAGLPPWQTVRAENKLFKILHSDA